MVNLQFITHYTDKYSYLDGALMALKGGCKWIQLRIKDATNDEIRGTAKQLQALCKTFQATFIIDDHVELAKELKLDGVHLGKNDMPINEARQILGPDFIIGGTANTFEDIVMHYKNGANYIGCGPFRFTTTKKNLSPILGLDGYRTLVKQMHEANIHIPVVAIGGITYNDIQSILQTGIDGIALSGTILNASNPIEETQRIIAL